jgi:prepilin-type N-terminal cleavage/methylation domain-containing protein/prepilin-type processing-associated H-X9-DG protein
MYSRPINHQSRTGFTLIELLVVIAIIAILAAILFPVFARAREQARKTACASNLKQLGLSFAQYRQDYDEKLPHDDQAYSTSSTNVGYWDGTTTPGCANAICSSPLQDPPSAISSTALRWPYRLLPYTKSTQIYQCPSSTFPTNTTTPNNQRVGYWANGATLFTPSASGAGPRSLSSINEASRVVMLYDQIDSTNANMGNTRWLWYRLGYRSDLGKWTDNSTFDNTNATRQGPHNEIFNVLWADGHVKAIKQGAMRNAIMPANSSVVLQPSAPGEAPFPE